MIANRQSLFSPAIARLRSHLSQENIEEAIGHFHEQVEFIREQRDDVHQSLMLWDPILAAWKVIEMTRCTESETKITELYRFIARHYLSLEENAPHVMVTDEQKAKSNADVKRLTEKYGDDMKMIETLGNEFVEYRNRTRDSREKPRFSG